MAHQAHNIPWTALTSHLKWKSARHAFPADLYPVLTRAKPETRNKQILYFVEQFVKNIRQHSLNERNKFPKTYDPPNGMDQVILSDALAAKLGPSMHKILDLPESEIPEAYAVKGPYRERLCTHVYEAGCGCAIPYEERRASAFVRKYQSNPCYQFFIVNGAAFYNLELVKLLLLHGEMNMVLRVCSLPGVDLAAWHTRARCYCEFADAGWDRVYQLALQSYICLNVIYHFPEIWDPRLRSKDAKDYRAAKCYQQTLNVCTGSGDTSEVVMLPHRHFFGIEQDQLRAHGGNAGEIFGLVSLDTLLNIPGGTRRVPHADDVSFVRQVLQSKGLPIELVLDVLELAGYEPRRRLKVAHDPFHPDNRTELGEYLTYCWKVIVRCDVVGRALQEPREPPVVPWRGTILDTVNTCFGFNVPRPEEWEFEFDEGSDR